MISQTGMDSPTGSISGSDSGDGDRRIGNFFKVICTEMMERSLTLVIRFTLFKIAFLDLGKETLGGAL